MRRGGFEGEERSSVVLDTPAYAGRSAYELPSYTKGGARGVVKKGALWQRRKRRWAAFGVRGARWTARWFELRESSAVLEAFLNEDDVKPCAGTFVKRCTVSEIGLMEGRMHTFKVVDSAGAVLILSASTARDMWQWTAALRDASSTEDRNLALDMMKQGGGAVSGGGHEPPRNVKQYALAFHNVISPRDAGVTSRALKTFDESAHHSTEAEAAGPSHREVRTDTASYASRDRHFSYSQTNPLMVGLAAAKASCVPAGKSSVLKSDVDRKRRREFLLGHHHQQSDDSLDSQSSVRTGSRRVASGKFLVSNIDSVRSTEARHLRNLTRAVRVVCSERIAPEQVEHMMKRLSNLAGEGKITPKGLELLLVELEHHDDANIVSVVQTGTEEALVELAHGLMHAESASCSLDGNRKGTRRKKASHAKIVTVSTVKQILARTSSSRDSIPTPVIEHRRLLRQQQGLRSTPPPPPPRPRPPPSSPPVSIGGGGEASTPSPPPSPRQGTTSPDDDAQSPSCPLNRKMSYDLVVTMEELRNSDALLEAMPPPPAAAADKTHHNSAEALAQFPELLAQIRALPGAEELPVNLLAEIRSVPGAHDAELPAELLACIRAQSDPASLPVQQQRRRRMQLEDDEHLANIRARASTIARAKLDAEHLANIRAAAAAASQPEKRSLGEELLANIRAIPGPDRRLPAVMLADIVDRPPSISDAGSDQAAAAAAADETVTAEEGDHAKRRTRFDVVHMRFFDYTLGQSCPSDGGPSIGLGWEFDPDEQLCVTVDDFEAFRGGNWDDEHEGAGSDVEEEWDDNWRIPRQDFSEDGVLHRQHRTELLRSSGHRRVSIDLNGMQMHHLHMRRRREGRSKASKMVIDGDDPDEVAAWEADMVRIQGVRDFAKKWFTKTWPNRPML